MWKMGICGFALILSNPTMVIAEESEDCDASIDMTYVCGPINAEDLVLIPGTDWILSSAMAPGGGIYLVDAGTREWRQLYSGNADQVRHDKAYGACTTPPQLQGFISHGLHIRARSDGRATLYVVGHGSREAIEIFDVALDSGEPALTWTGCVAMPGETAANSVTSLRDGTILATVLMHPGQNFSDVFSGKPTGAIYRWSPGDRGFALVAGSELPGNNGIEISSDESEIFVVSSGLATISVFSNSSPTRLLRSTERLDFGPDNIHMTASGQLITAGPSSTDHGCGELDIENVNLEEFAICPKGSVAALYDPETLTETNRWSSPPDARFSNATMALQVGDQIWIGTFAGNRIGVLDD